MVTRVRREISKVNHRVYYLETKDDGPDKTQGEAVVPIHNVMWAHVFKMDFLLLKKLQGFINILKAVDAHAALSWFWLKWTAKRRKV